MNQDTFKGMWKQAKGQMQKTWGKLTNDDMDQIQGNQQMLIGKLQERYGWSKAEATAKVNEFLAQHNTGNSNNSSLL